MSPTHANAVIDEIRARLPISEVVAEYVRLQRAGGRLKGLCPFHDEKTPSFTVSDDRGFFHCFGCGEGGDVFSFWMKVEHGSFPEAVRALAERAGVRLTQDWGGARRGAGPSREDRLFEVTEAAASFYQSMLRDRRGRAGLDYLRGRGVSDEMIEHFRIGFAPEGWDHLKGHLAAAGVSTPLAVETGLVVERDDRRSHYDRFRSRVIFPVGTAGGRIAAFGGRIVGEGEPKYLNSPESPIYAKSRILYGMSHNKDAIRREKRAFVVEGYMDLVALVQHGVEAVVATCGTALTRGHLNFLRRLGAEAVLVFDGDTAGRRAARRALDVVLAEGVPARVLRLPEGHDPDTFVRDEGPEAFLAEADRAPELFEATLEDLCAGAAGAEERMARVRELLPALQGAADPLVREAHAERMAQRLGVPFAAVREAMRKHTGPSRRPETRESAPEPRRASRAEVQLTSLLIARPDLADSQDMRAALAAFADRDLASVVETVLAIRDEGRAVSSAAIHDGVADRPEAARWLARLSVAESIWDGEPDEGLPRRMFVDCCEHLLGRERRETSERLKAAMAAAAARGDLEEARRLDAEWRDLLRTTKRRGGRVVGTAAGTGATAEKTR